MTLRPEPKPPAAGLDIVDRRVGGTLVITVTGEIDLETAPTLQTAVTAAIDQTSGQACVVDLTAVTFLGSAGLAALVEAARISKSRHEPFRIVVDANRMVTRPIVVTGVDDELALYHSIEEALTA